MAVSASSLVSAGSITDATSYATASISPTSNALVLVWVYSIGAALPNTPTVTGASMTWVEVANVDDTSVRKGTLFRGMASSPGTGALTIDFGGQTQTGCAWQISEFTNVTTTGTNGSGAVVQSATNFNSSTVTDLTVTLGAFGSANNATYGAFGIPLNTAGKPDSGTGFTELGQVNQASPNLAIVAGWRSDNDTSVDGDWSPASVPAVGVAVEIKELGTDRYWVGGTANWDATVGTKWADSSGGTGGVPVPTSSNDVYFDASSGAGTTTILATANCRSLDFTGFTGTLTGSAPLNIYGSLTMGSGMTRNYTGGISFNGTGAETLTTNGITLSSVTISSSGGSVTLQDNLVIGTTSSLTFYDGTFDANDFDVSSGLYGLNSSGGSPVLEMRSGTFTITGTGFVWTASVVNPNVGTSTILITDTSATSKTFTGSGRTYNILTVSGNNVRIGSSNTFNTININNAGLSTGLAFSAGTTQTITGGITTNGSAGNLATLLSRTEGSPATLSKASGNVIVDYMSIKDSTVTGGASWYAGLNSTDVSGNTGWIFTDPPLTITQDSRFDNTNTFYSGTVVPPETTVTQASLYTNGDTFYAGGLLQITYVVQDSRYDNSLTVYGGNLYTLVTHTSRFDNTNTFYAAGITTVTTVIQSSRFNNTSTFYSGSTTVYAVQDTRHDSDNIFYDGTVERLLEYLDGTRFDNINTFYAGHSTGVFEVDTTNNSGEYTVVE